MRIIAGTYRGHRLKTLRGGRLRPTSDQLRETLFDVVGPAIQGSAFLDAYAGSGAVGLEALSRGAREVVFVEHHRAAADLIRENLENLGVGSGFQLLTCSVPTGVEKLEGAGARFDYVFVDPPYDQVYEYHHALRQLARSPLILPTSLVIVEHSRHVLLEDSYGALVRRRVLRHGDTQLAFYRRE